MAELDISALCLGQKAEIRPEQLPHFYMSTRQSSLQRAERISSYRPAAVAKDERTVGKREIAKNGLNDLIVLAAERTSQTR